MAALLKEDFPTAAYHAGLDSDRRSRVQDAFLNGKLEVIVATIAFGMGIDKANIRSVIHTALPGSIEAYYQEIGRAGRDGEMSRAILMHSYADRYTHDFFFERDYPEAILLDKIYSRLGAEPQPRDVIEKQVRIGADVFEKALEKLWAHGGAVIDYSDNVSRGTEEWRQTYLEQGSQKQSQIESMIRYAQGQHCRMSTLVRHFGDVQDGQKPCEICDFCAPADCIAQHFRAPDAEEERVARAAIEALRGSSRSVGRLHTELCGDRGLSRDEFEELLGAMARVALVVLTDAVFEKDGKQIPFRKVHLTRDAEYVNDNTPLGLTIRDAAPAGARKGAKAKTHKKKKTVFAAKAASGKRPAARETKAEEPSQAEKMMRAWRTGVAKKQAVPAFRIMSDRVLLAIAEEQPRTAAELLEIPGMGIKMVEKYGAQIYRILNELQK